MASVNLGLGHSISATCGWRQNLYDQIGSAFNSFLGNDVLASLGYEKKVGLQH
jgi:hypothetical protein